MSLLVYKEVTPFVETDENWNDVTINAGASQSTLQDIKLPEVAGCFYYQNSRELSSVCSNRFIYWRTNHDIIELVEVSLDTNLQSNRLRLRFQNTPILRGVSIHEHNDQVVLLVATVSAIHKLVFPHPESLGDDDFLVKTKGTLSPSLFYDTTNLTLRNRSCFFVLNNVSIGIPLPHTSCSWLNANGNATFILANNAGSVLMVEMSNKHEVQITTTELTKSGSLFKFLNGLVPVIMKNNQNEVALSIVYHKDASDVLIFSLFSDLQIKVWSEKKQECILADSIFNYDIEKKLLAGNFTAHQCLLRISVSDVSGNFYIGVYVPIPHQKVFYIFKPTVENDRLKLVLLTTLHQKEHDLVDFCIGEKRLWTLWLSNENQPLVFTAMLGTGNFTEQQLNWLPVSLESKVSSVIDCESIDPQDIYLREIFKVDRFLPSSILKAVNILSSSKNKKYSSHISKKGDLKNLVIETVGTEILLSTGDIERNDESFYNIASEIWGRFFSYCIQYHEVGMKPLGVSLDPKTGCVIIIKKNFFSLLCPCDSLDIIMNPKLRSSSYFMDFLEDEDRKLYSVLKNVLNCIDLVRENTDNKLLQRFDDKMIALQSPLKYAHEISETLDLEVEGKFCGHLHSLITSVTDVMQCLEFLLKKLDLVAKIDETSDANQFSSFAGSNYGIGALCAGLSSFAKQRFDFCRDLLLFEFALCKIDVLDYEQLDSNLMQYTIIPKTLTLLRSYYTVWWCTVCEYVPVSASTQDSAFKQFRILELSQLMDSDLTTVKSGQTVCNLFFQEEGGIKARQIMKERLPPLFYDGWKYLFPSLVMSAASIFWPVDGNLIFPEFLFARCQYRSLQEYEGLFHDSFISNKQFLNFLVASSHLILGESHKAMKIYLEVSREIESESLLCNKLIKGQYSSTCSVMSQFCMRVIRLLEQFSLSDCIVNFTSSALNEVDKSDSNIPIFYSVLFKHYLNVNRMEEAFATLTNNPDPSRRKDCLRQLIVRLCESKQFQKIIYLSYKECEDEIISILESRARCSDLSHNTSFYGVLYSLHIDHRKFRKAATVMYELAMRFGREVVSLKGLKKQVSCLLAAINCLHLAEPQYAWIVKPALNVNASEGASKSRNSPKRGSDGSEIIQSPRPVKVEVLGLSDIMQEYSLVQARLLYIRKNVNSLNIANTPLTAEETVALLLDGCLFEQAIILSKSFSLSLVPVFKVLTNRCLNSSHPVRDFDELDKNVFSKAQYHSEISSSHANFQQYNWNILKNYLLEHEVDGKSELHNCVTEKLLVNGASVPAWLKLSYQKRNFTELLCLYIKYNLIEESIILLTKYLKAVLGVQKEDYDLKFSLNVTSPAVWLPHTLIDVILDAISENKNEQFQDACKDFTDTLEQYNRTLDSVNESKLSNN